MQIWHYIALIDLMDAYVSRAESPSRFAFSEIFSHCIYVLFLYFGAEWMGFEIGSAFIGQLLAACESFKTVNHPGLVCVLEIKPYHPHCRELPANYVAHIRHCVKHSFHLMNRRASFSWDWPNFHSYRVDFGQLIVSSYTSKFLWHEFGSSIVMQWLLQFRSAYHWLVRLFCLLHENQPETSLMPGLRVVSRWSDL